LSPDIPEPRRFDSLSEKSNLVLQLVNSRKGQNMTGKSKSSTDRPRFLSTVLVALSTVLIAVSFLGTLVPFVKAQGLPVDTGSHLPVALWAVGTAVLGLVLVYGIAKNRQRTMSEKQLTERATKDLYAREDQAEHPNRTSPPIK
jgi:threonine/homoserine/homoserine lactone efflux protein